MAASLPSREQILEALVKKQGSSAVEKLQQATVAICGLGGLGSNVAISLARAGVGRLILIDFDKVDITNLHRQQYKMNQVGVPKAEALLENLKEIAPYVQYETHLVRVTAENAILLLREADIICECFDKAEAKAMLVDVVLEHLPQKHLVAANGMAGYESANNIKTRRITDKLCICGDGKSDIENVAGLIAPRVMLCAAHQAMTAIQLILGQTP